LKGGRNSIPKAHSSLIPGTATFLHAMEQLLERQRVALHQILLEQQLCVQRLFAEHQKAMECLLVQETLKPVTPRTMHSVPARTESNQAYMSILSFEPKPASKHAPLVTVAAEDAMPDSESSESSDEDEVHRTVSRALPVQGNKLQMVLLPIVQNKWFHVAVNAAIILNTVFLGVRVNWEMKIVIKELSMGRIPEVEYPPIYRITGIVFFYFFLLEMLLRILAEQKQFWFGPGLYWNLFDLVCLASMALEQIPPEKSVQLLGFEDVATLRVLRLLRIFRAARSVRLFAQFKQLRLMLYSVVSCLVSMFWAISLLLLLICLFALYLEDSSVSFLLETKSVTMLETKDEPWKKTLAALNENWNGMGDAVVSLIYSVSGGADWGDLASPFWTVKGGCGLSYMAFIILTIFGLLNILVGIFVQEAEEISKWDDNFVTDVADFLKKRKKRDKQVLRLFSKLDKTNTGAVSLHDLTESLHNEKVKSKFKELGINVEKVEILLNVIDVDGNGTITRDEFTQGLSHLTGRANATDVAHLLMEEHKIDSKMDDIKDDICQRIETMHQRMDVLHRRFDATAMPGGNAAGEEKRGEQLELSASRCRKTATSSYHH